MKKIILLFLLVWLVFTGCANKEPVEIIVFGAASMTETLTQLGEDYMADHKDISIVFNFDSSGTLKAQIEEGAPCDIFISAGQKQMNELDCVMDGTRFDILENKVALAVPEGNPRGITSFGQLAEGLTDGSVFLAIGNADVPVGQYTQKILEYYGLNEDELSANLTYGSNVKEVTTQVSEATVDCGIIYQTDACSAGLTVVDMATADMCGQVIYPAAVMEDAPQAEAAKDFLEYLVSDHADALFEGVGFTPIG